MQVGVFETNNHYWYSFSSIHYVVLNTLSSFQASVYPFFFFPFFFCVGYSIGLLLFFLPPSLWAILLLCCYWVVFKTLESEWSSRRFYIRSTACYWRVSDLQDISHFKEMLRPYYYHIVSLQCSPLSLYNFISRKIPTQRTDR